MPEDAIQPHWSSEGFGRRSVRSLVWGLLHPRKALKSLCSIQLRLMSRLEFNDAGMIVRHEDTWGMREAIEGILPFASIIYPLHRRIVGTLVSFSIAKGFSLRDSIIFRKPLSISDGEPNAPHGITASSSSGESTPLARQQLAQSVTNEAHGQGQGQDPHVAALALLDRSQYKGHNNPEHYRTISRSRNASPSRYRWGNISERSFQTGTRSRARSLIGGVQTGGGGGTTTTSSVAGSNDNLSLWYAGHHHMHSGSSILDRERDRDLPPDSSARYRDRVARRADGGRTTSAPPSTLGDTAPVADVGVGMQANAPSSLAGLWMDDFGRKDRIQGAD
ncbi:hypothetical protein K437DRAFT_271002 [Tilletiaria anomala UBC 951]|uniref:Uncharacterized protein n=1 Tax=Tilletiaria anomala (strain ATCC 24038 / CBS 436.72 / UBC 951) TaxID=1037660 RepID=A0A066V9F6_TILAU|nr:uncharacterized protein K437DRAFT_271002 [Tilletiaria anomala UBC 951]KDN36918.1 hypothetical protein K437DRAFT_271002 [Tilletiaria anomala UBC 951]